MSSLPKVQKYIMFLNPIYFKKSFFTSIYNKIKRKLENKGITLFNIDDANFEIQKKINNKTTKITFDDLLFPNTNTLYIHLFDYQYYSDNMYNKKKLEREREMLFLLAGKLGVKKINFDTEIIETTITKLNANIKIKGKGLSARFTKSINKSTGSSGEEEYINRGSPVYLKFTNLQDVEKNIENKMGSTIFNYNFYKNNPKLASFVYKRYEFKMQKLEYTIETEDVSDLSFAVKTCFMDYGINISFDKSISYYENVHYKLEFFTDDELKREFGKKIRNYKDKFYTIREYYDLLENKDKAVHFITEYVMEYADKYNYRLIDNLDDRIHNFSKHIQNFIKETPPGSFEGICHTFQSTSQIRNWINKEFLNDNMEIINEMDITDNNNNDVIKEEKIETTFNKYDKMSVILPFEKKDNMADLQNQLENIFNNDDNDSLKLTSFESIMNIEDKTQIEEQTLLEENRLQAQIEETRLKEQERLEEEQYRIKREKMIEASFEAAMRLQKERQDEYNKIIQDDYESVKALEDSYKTDNNNINYRSPVFPASSTISINSVFDIEQSVYPPYPPPPPPSISSDA